MLPERGSENACARRSVKGDGVSDEGNGREDDGDLGVWAWGGGGGRGGGGGGGVGVGGSHPRSVGLLVRPSRVVAHDVHGSHGDDQVEAHLVSGKAWVVSNR